jgi:hypothetical protein
MHGHVLAGDDPRDHHILLDLRQAVEPGATSGHRAPVEAKPAVEAPGAAEEEQEHVLHWSFPQRRTAIRDGAKRASTKAVSWSSEPP